MRRTWLGVRGATAILLGLLGCSHAIKPKMEAPKLVEEYVIPPSDDPRFSKYVEYPKETLNKGIAKQNDSSLPTPPPIKPASRFGAGGGPGM